MLLSCLWYGRWQQNQEGDAGVKMTGIRGGNWVCEDKYTEALGKKPISMLDGFISMIEAKWREWGQIWGGLIFKIHKPTATLPTSETRRCF